MLILAYADRTRVDLDKFGQRVHHTASNGDGPSHRQVQLGELFAGCELGAMPPFGNLYGMEVFASPELSRHERIAFNAGTHAELIQISYVDFEHLVKPEVLGLAFSN